MRYDDDDDEDTIPVTWAVNGEKIEVDRDAARNDEPDCSEVVVSRGYLWAGELTSDGAGAAIDITVSLYRVNMISKV